MTFPLHLLLPLASSFGYVAGVLLLKRSAAFGVGIWRTTFIANLLHTVCLAPLWLLGPGPGAGSWWQPLITGVLFFIGQIATFVAIERGEVSVATPILGNKIILVALISALLLPDPVPLKWWIAAALSTTAIALLNRRSAHTPAGMVMKKAGMPRANPTMPPSPARSVSSSTSSTNAKRCAPKTRK